MTLYKLTDEDGYTRRGQHNEIKWELNKPESVSASFSGHTLCTPDVIHAYEDPYIAILMNPRHANLRNPILWEAEGEIVARDGDLKCGVKTLTLRKRLDIPVITTEQYVMIAILCALEVYGEASFVEWAKAWLSGRDRSGASARSARGDAAAAAAAAADAAAAAAYAAATYAAATYAAAAAAATTAAVATNKTKLDLKKIINRVFRSNPVS